MGAHRRPAIQAGRRIDQIEQVGAEPAEAGDSSRFDFGEPQFHKAGSLVKPAPVAHGPASKEVRPRPDRPPPSVPCADGRRLRHPDRARRPCRPADRRDARFRAGTDHGAGWLAPAADGPLRQRCLCLRARLDCAGVATGAARRPRDAAAATQRLRPDRDAVRPAGGQRRAGLPRPHPGPTCAPTG